MVSVCFKELAICRSILWSRFLNPSAVVESFGADRRIDGVKKNYGHWEVDLYIPGNHLCVQKKGHGMP